MGRSPFSVGETQVQRRYPCRWRLGVLVAASFACLSGALLSPQAGGDPLTTPLPAVLRLQLTIYGKLGNDLPAVDTAFLDRAQKWILVSFMRSMVDDAHHNGTSKTAGSVKFTELEPKWNYSVVKPWAKTDANGVKVIKSPFQRTRFDNEFSQGVTLESANLAAERVCSDYKREDKILLTSLMRSLDLAESYPFQAVDVIGGLSNGLFSDLSSFLILDVFVTAQGGKTEPICVGGGPGSEAFNVSPCPANAMRCDDKDAKTDFCTAAEKIMIPPICRCNPGYQGDVSGSDGLRVVGTCTSRTTYCVPKGEPGKEGSYELLKPGPDGSLTPAGALHEEVKAKCLPGFTAENNAKCLTKDATTGYWNDEPKCVYHPPKKPPRAVCPTPVGQGLTIASGCFSCPASPYEKFASQLGDDCLCGVQCNDPWTCAKDCQGAGLQQLKCVEEEVVCPVQVKWVIGKCVDLTSGAEAPNPFCCPEPWVDGVVAVAPPAALTNVAACTAITGISQCYTSFEASKDVVGAPRGPDLPCCWRQSGWGRDKAVPSCAARTLAGDGSGTNGTEVDDECAIRRKVTKGTWNKNPVCAMPCKKPDATTGVIITGCEGCLAGQAPEACPCNLKCDKDNNYVHFGGDVGSRSCQLDGTFGLLPVCRPPAIDGGPTDLCMTRPCWPLAQNLSTDLLGRGACSQERKDSVDTTSCVGLTVGKKCKASCAAGEGFRGALVGGSYEYECKKGQMKPKEVDKCEDLTTPFETGGCVMSIERTTRSPCCWRASKFQGTTAQCVPMGSPFIKAGSWPDGYLGSGPITGCAVIEGVGWSDRLPECSPFCDSSVFNKPGLLYSPLTADPEDHGCYECMAASKTAVEKCDTCQVRCDIAGGFRRYGGGAEGNYVCRSDVTFATPPACRKPGPGESGSDGGSDGGGPLVCPSFPQTFWDNLKATPTPTCPSCKPGAPETCNCEVACWLGYMDAKKLPTKKHCNKTKIVVTTTPSCSTLGKGDCLTSVEGVGKPCCWSPDLVKCLARGSQELIFAPEACAAEWGAEWDPNPECKQLCDASELAVVPTSPFTVENCDKCIVNELCPLCKVACKSAYESVGGGLEGTRQCTDANEKLAPPPACLPKPSPPACTDQPTPPGGAASVILTKTGWTTSCLAGGTCGVDSLCSANYQLLTSASWPAAVGLKKCLQDNAVAATAASCEAILDQATCLKSQQGGVSCCYRSAGFDDAGVIKCAKSGDPKITAKRSPDSCATLVGAKWETLPNCQPKCSNNFKDDVDLLNSGCDDCFKDPANGPCTCKVDCKAGSQIAQAWQGKLPVTFQCDKTTGQFPTGPTCLPPVSSSSFVRTCDMPDSDEGKRIVSDTCAKCDNSGTTPCTACTVKCNSPQFKLITGTGMGTEGARTCTAGDLDCPASPTWDAAALTCTKSGVTYSPVCCDEYGAPQLKDKVRKAVWDPPVLPTCRYKCNDLFTGTPYTTVSASCASCAPGDPSCDCKVACDSTSTFYGGAAQGTRTCKAQGTGASATSAFDPISAPVCGPKLPTMVEQPCPLPAGEGLQVTGCSGCTVWENKTSSPCSCSVGCASGYLDTADVLLLGTRPKTCQWAPRTLTTVGSASSVGCSTLDSTTCTSSQESRDASPCCLFAGNRCNAMGAADVTGIPLSCALVWKANFEATPTCKPKCSSGLAGPGVTVKGCTDCFVGGACSCEVSCTDGADAYKGGGALGTRTCAALPTGFGDFGVRPICGTATDVDRNPMACARVDLVAKLVNHVLPSECASCPIGSATCTGCDVTCAAGYIFDTITAKSKNLACDSVDREVDATNACSKRTTDTACLTTLSGVSSRCCWQVILGIGRCYDKGSPNFSPSASEQPYCSQLTQPRWATLPTCVKACVLPDLPDSVKNNLVISEGCSSCIPGQPCPACTATCKAPNVQAGGAPAGALSCSADTKTFASVPICVPPEPAPTCPLPETTANPKYTALPGIAPWASVQLQTSCSGCRSTDVGCCKVTCNTGYATRTVGGPGTTAENVACKEGGVATVNTTAACASYLDEGTCLAAGQWANTTIVARGWRPCCWHPAGADGPAWCKPWSSSTMTQLPGLTADGAPKCAATRSASWGTLPDCQATCTNNLLKDAYNRTEALKCQSCRWEEYTVAATTLPVYTTASETGQSVTLSKTLPDKFVASFAEDQNGSSWVRVKALTSTVTGWIKAAMLVDVTKATLVGAACACQAKCNSPLYMLAAGGGAEGARQCRFDFTKNVAVFGPSAAPKCSVFCSRPSTKRGTRTVRGCQCFLGDVDCFCEVKCATGNVRTTGSALPFHTCDVTGKYLNLPSCKPQCPVPEKQTGALDLTSCPKPCFAEDSSCACTLTCNQGYMSDATWECHRFTSDQNEAWCAVAGVQDSWEYKFFGTTKMCYNSAGGACTCCRRPIKGGPTGKYICTAEYPTEVQAEAAPYPIAVPRWRAEEWECHHYPIGATPDWYANNYGNNWCNKMMVDGSTMSMGGTLYNFKYDIAGKSCGTCRCCKREIIEVGKYQRVPVCLPDMLVTTVHAVTGVPVAGCLVSMYIDTGYLKRAETGSTNSVGVATITTDLDTMYFDVTPNGTQCVGFAMTRHMTTRKEVCAPNGGSCTLQLGLLPEIAASGGSTRVDPGYTDSTAPSCYVDSTVAGTFDINVMLEWNNNVKDLDLWVRSWDCGVDAEVRYNCGRGTTIASAANLAAGHECAMADFESTLVRDSENRACGTFLKDTATNRDAPSNNQFQKWAVGKYKMTNLHRRLPTRSNICIANCPLDARVGSSTFGAANGAGGRVLCPLPNADERWCDGDQCCPAGGDGKTFPCPSASTGWDGCEVKGKSRADCFTRVQPSTFSILQATPVADNSITIPRHTDTYLGPEVGVLHNVPPGRYQIAVNVYTAGSIVVNDGAPRITLQVGQTLYRCKINPACTAKQRIWSVADILIQDVAGKPLSKKFRILDTAGNMAALSEHTLPVKDWRKFERVVGKREQPSCANVIPYPQNFYGKTVCLKSFRGKYISDQTPNFGSANGFRIVATCQDREKFKVIQFGEGLVLLRSFFNTQMIEKAGILTSTSSYTSAEVWKVTDAGGGKVWLQSAKVGTAGGLYLSDQAGTSENKMASAVDRQRSWEQWEFVATDGTNLYMGLLNFAYIGYVESESCGNPCTPPSNVVLDSSCRGTCEPLGTTLDARKCLDRMFLTPTSQACGGSTGDSLCKAQSGAGSYCKFWQTPSVCQGSNLRCNCSDSITSDFGLSSAGVSFSMKFGDSMRFTAALWQGDAFTVQLVGASGEMLFKFSGNTKVKRLEYQCFSMAASARFDDQAWPFDLVASKVDITFTITAGTVSVAIVKVINDPNDVLVLSMPCALTESAVKKFQVTNLYPVDFEYTKASVTSTVTSTCSTPCSASECTPAGGAVRCWSQPAGQSAGAWATDASACYAKHDETDDRWCWSQKTIDAGLKCCTR